MAKKKKVERPKHKPTKRQLSNWQKQKRRQRFIIGIGVSIFVAVLGFVWAGVYYQWYVPNVKPMKETVVEVNDTKFDLGYYIDAARYQLSSLSPEYISYFLDMVVEGIQQGELIRQEAEEMGISVSGGEIDEAIEEDGLPNNQAVRDFIEAQLLVEKIRDEYIETLVPESVGHRHIMAMFLESEIKAEEIRGKLLAWDDFEGYAAELSLESYTQENNGDLGWKPEGVLGALLETTVLDDIVFVYQMGAVSYPIEDAEKTKDLGYWLIEVLERNEETGEANVRAMLLSSQEEAEDVLGKLEEGEDFDALAYDYSQAWSETDGADLGWVAPGDKSVAFDACVFDSDIELNEVSSPIRDEEQTTTGGYWLFEVLDSETRQLSEEDRATLVDNALNDWLEALWEDPDNSVLSYLDDEMKVLVVEKF